MLTAPPARDVARRFAGSACTHLLDVLRGPGSARVHTEGARTLAPGRKIAGRAVAVGFLPERPNLAAQAGREFVSSDKH
jgi:hypothetical protein